MREFYFKDKHSNKIICGILPHNDVNCDPFDYFRMTYAYHLFQEYCDLLMIQKAEPIVEKIISNVVLQEIDSIIADKFSSTKPNPAVHELLTNESLDKHHQTNLLKGITLRADDILWLNKEASDLGYLLDIYHEQTFPDKFKKHQMPYFFHQEDGKTEHFGKTNMTEGDMKALLEQRKVIQVRRYHKGAIWHCFYFTFKGLAGLESGLLGRKPHYHYLSDKSGQEWQDLLRRIKLCDMPSSKVHLVIDRR